MSSAAGPSRRGINHLALVTNDMDATVRFWHGVLGARLAAHLDTPGFRHYFFEFGPEQTVAFFEHSENQVDAFQAPAVRELARDGRLSTLPHTRLSRHEVVDPA